MLHRLNEILFGPPQEETDTPIPLSPEERQRLLQQQALNRQLIRRPLSLAETTRTCIWAVILGANGTGKTTFVKQVVASTRQRVLIITPDDVEYNEKDEFGNPLYPLNPLRTKEDFVFEGVCRHIWDPDWTPKVIHNFKKGLIIFDDCRSYLPARTDQFIHSLMIRRRQQELDVMVIGHGFSEVPPKFFTFATHYILFRTEDNINIRREYIRSFEKMRRLQWHVNRRAKKDPHYHLEIKVSEL